jgi:hypothetical protein
MKLSVKLAAAIFVIVSLTHLCRIVMGWDIVIAGHVVPMWVSIPGAVLFGALAYFLWHESGQHRRRV